MTTETDMICLMVNIWADPPSGQMTIGQMKTIPGQTIPGQTIPGRMTCLTTLRNLILKEEVWQLFPSNLMKLTVQKLRSRMLGISYKQRRKLFMRR